MPPTRQDFLSRVKAPLTNHDYVPALLKSAAVQAERLTGQPEWDAFLTKIQAKHDDYLMQAQSWIEQLKVAGTPEQVKTCQINVAIYENCARLALDVMALPGEILAAHRGNDS